MGELRRDDYQSFQDISDTINDLENAIRYLNGDEEWNKKDFFDLMEDINWVTKNKLKKIKDKTWKDI